VNWKSPKIALRLMMPLFAVATMLAPMRVRADNDPVERTFTEPRAEIERAVTAAKASSSGKLPALEGFVGQTQRPVERYEKAYYQCIFQVIPSASGEVSVRVTAKITAWYDDPDKQRSGYEVLPSNGRLENDALDRVEEILEGPDAVSANTEKQPARKYNLSLGPVIPHAALPGGASGDPKISQPAPVKITSAPLNEEEIQQLRKKRVTAEKRVQQLNNALQNLQELYDSQTKPTNLVAVKKAGTPVFAHPEETGKPLFVATVKDQFEMVEIRGDWIHVNISSQSRGWIRKTQLEFSDDTSAAKSTGSGLPPKSAELFRVTREETSIFPGNWEPLRGKRVKLYSVQPAQSAVAETQGRDKRNFAKELFERALKEPSPAESPVAGVVVIFDSADGGQASATFASLKLWREGKIPEAAFWQSCSLDPAETFSAAAKKQ
jgi:hypothetical protein